jgi:hypothetical protein
MADVRCSKTNYTLFKIEKEGVSEPSLAVGRRWSDLCVVAVL